MSETIALFGAAGRFGKHLAVWAQSAGYDLIALSSGDDPALADAADIVVDSTRLEVSESVVKRAIAREQKVLVATSGWGNGHTDSLRSLLELHAQAGVLVVPNFSLGSTLATFYAAKLAAYFPDAEIIEAHHKGKLDAPSGTAAYTAEAIRAVTSQPVPIHSLRLDGINARQEVVFGAAGERVVLAHETQGYDCYRAGFLHALKAMPSIRGLLYGLGAVLDLK